MGAAAQIIALARWTQVPLLTLLLLGGCAAKLVRVVRAGSVSAGLGPTDLFPRRLRRPAAMTLCATEAALGAALILTLRRGVVHAALAAAGDTVRVAAGLFFLVAAYALVEVRERRPDVGCGCFGDLSARPVGKRSIVRATVLGAAALVSVGAPPLHLPAAGWAAAGGLAVVVAELLVLAALSPEAAEILVRLGYTEPCETRVIPPHRVLSALHRSMAWRRRSRMITGSEPVDMWRELCWWYVVYPAADSGLRHEIVFAVQVAQRRPAVRAAVIGAPPPPAARPSRMGAPPPLSAPPPEDQEPAPSVL